MTGLERELRAAVRGEVDFGAAARALTTMDASNYRRVPAGVVAPRDTEDVAAALRVAAEAGVPVVPRGGGTSIGGQATGTGVVLDFTRHMAGLIALDPAARTAVVQPGLVLDALRAAAAPYGLTFGPDPSTRSRCTLGGMIGNNACGPHSVAWGTTADNVAELSVLTYGNAGADGGRNTGVHRIGTGWAGAPAGLQPLITAHLGLLRTGMPADFGRRISGYALDALLPERGVGVARAFCGSEGTLGVVTEAVVRLVEAPRAPVLLVLGYADESAAADAAAGLLPFGPLTVEGMAADLLPGPAAAGLPRGAAWLFVEMPDAATAAEAARAADAVDSALVADPAGQRALWRIREDAAGTATRLPDGGEAWPGWEDCAVPPARLGGYLREFRALLRRYGLRGAPYGHFGEGCVHARIDFDLVTADGVARFREFSSDLADLVVAHGGSLSGEHGDGQARAELLPRMYGPEVVDLFAAYKDAWDPAGGMNPGILVRPARLDENLRFAFLRDGGDRLPGPALPLAREVVRCVGVAKCRTTAVSGPGVMCPSYRVTGEEQHSTRGRARLLHEMLAGEVVTGGWRSEEVREALDLCLGCKGCLSDCPVGVDMAAYKTEFLHHHWSGRLRPLSHYTLGSLPTWLHLISTLRATRLFNTLTRLPAATRLSGLTPERPLPNLAREPFTRWWRRSAPRELGSSLRPLAGSEPSPALPESEPPSAPSAGDPSHPPLPGPEPSSAPSASGLSRPPLPGPELSPAPAASEPSHPSLPGSGPTPAPPAFEARGSGGGAPERGPGRSPHAAEPHIGTAGKGRGGERPPAGQARPLAALWPDTFTEYLAPEVGQAALHVLRAAGIDVQPPPGRVCCALTYTSTGRLARARTTLRRTLDTLDTLAPAETPLILLEPSCAAALRTDLPRLLPDDPRAARVAASVRTFAEALEELAPDWRPPRLDRPVAGQTHCHQHAVLGDAADRRLRERAGLTGELSGGCCGLAGNFGFEPGHYDVSVACAEEQLLPALRAADPDRAVVLADGFSCRTQITQLAPHTGRPDAPRPRPRHLAEVLAEALDPADPPHHPV
ncbi:FAD-linked oxidase C-terminal domain-containing protein [Streptomyces sp. NPDC051211]|uniref:FAD-binding and (Fe-S)-binding domain-containing protein n=1 Tax=Streptomyces sp. NPDC051211 TaxID=3154643 RepID=UPI00344B6BEB